MELQELLEHLEVNAVHTNEYSIARIISETIGDKAPSTELQLEYLAFQFREIPHEENSPWGSYYGPISTWVLEDGTSSSRPSLEAITQDALDYWAQRASQTENPLLLARYSGLVWDLSKLATGTQASHTFALQHADSLIRICDEGLCEHNIELIQKAKRAYQVAKSLGNTELIDRSVITIIELEDRIAIDDKAGLWGFAFDTLILDKEKRLDPKQYQHLIDQLEQRLARLVTAGDPWPCESAGIPLATLYRSQQEQEEVKRVIRLVGDAFESASEQAVPMLASSWLQHAHDIYTNFNMREEAERVSKRIAEVGPDVVQDMEEITTSTEISLEQLESYLEDITAGGLAKGIAQIAYQLTPRKGELEKLVIQLAKANPLSFLVTKTLQDHNGRPVATIGGIEDDLEGNVLHQLSQSLAINGFFLRQSLERLFEKYEVTSQSLVDHLYESPAFHPSKRGVLLAGITSYFQGDYVACIHILLPQAEAAFRNLLELMGVAVLRKNRQGGLQLRAFDDLLRDEALSACFGEDTTFYFRGVLTDQRCWNLRNEVCHGISPADNFAVSTCDRVLHVLMCLSQVRATESP